MRSRRQFLRDAGLIAGACLLPRRSAAAGAPRPRRFVQIILQGGVDALLSTDPKPATAVMDGIAVPYGEHEIVRSGAVAAAPLLAPLGDELARFALLNGVRCSTAAHHTGMARLQQLRMLELERSRDFASVVGERLDRNSPLQVMRIGVYAQDYFFPLPDRSMDVYVAPRWSTLDLLAGSGRGSLAGILGARQGAQAAAARFLAALPGPPPPPTPLGLTAPTDGLRLPATPPWQETAARWSLSVRDALYALEHDLAPAVVIVDPSSYDTHLYNLPGQTLALRIFIAALTQLLAGLRRLGGDVAVMISSELGRFPLLNSWSGKDHLPELPVLFWGPGLRPGSYGHTDERMLAAPISFAAGTPSGSGKVPTLDEVAATVLEWLGIKDGLSSGYPGECLGFLLGG